MAFRAGAAATLVLFAVGCGGQTGASAGGDSSVALSDGASSGGSGSSGGRGGGSGGSSSGVTTGRDSSGSSSSGGGDASDGVADVEIPDAFPASCSAASFPLTANVAPTQCAFTPADVRCDTNADCTWQTTVGCGCFDLVYGVNRTSMVKCIPPPCVPLMIDCDASASGLYTQDCQFVPDPKHLAAACVNHRCLSFATQSGP